VRQFRLRQTGVTRIAADVVVDGGLGADHVTSIARMLRARLGYPFDIDVIECHAISRPPVASSRISSARSMRDGACAPAGAC